MALPTLRKFTPETLGDQQRVFMRLLPRLLDFIHSKGYEVTLGDGYRSPVVFGGIGQATGYGHPSSYHKSRLAIDLNLFLDGIYLVHTDDHRKFGEYWESLHPMCTWGGRFNDGNHYSFGESR
jgi:hypothetical protein